MGPENPRTQHSHVDWRPIQKVNAIPLWLRQWLSGPTRIVFSERLTEEHIEGSGNFADMGDESVKFMVMSGHSQLFFELALVR